MQIIMTMIGVVLRVVGIFLHPIFVWYRRFENKKIPAIKNQLLLVPAVDLAAKIRSQEVKSEEVVLAYIERIKEVNSFLNAVVQDRFEEAIKEAKRADEICQTTAPLELIKQYPLLGVPFTVKESCGLKGLSFAVGSFPRKEFKAPKNGLVVENLVSAGAIPLLVSANPEFCLSWETNSLINGKCRNPYDLRRTSGGSSGGEGALNSSGASPFGVASDIAGSIRIPSLYNGIFGHKPTGGIVNPIGHFPTSTDKNFHSYLQLGPMTRFAKDLPVLLHIMAGENAYQLNFSEPVNIKNIKIYYSEECASTIMCSGVNTDTLQTIRKAVEHFSQNNHAVQKVQLPNIEEVLEICLSVFFEMTDIPDMLAHPHNPKVRDNLFLEVVKNICGFPKYSYLALFFLTLQETGGFIVPEQRKKLAKKINQYKQYLRDLLGNDGVLLYPTFHRNAPLHGESLFNLPGVMFAMLFNLIGFPATHVPMGLDREGLPTGFQVIASPLQDKLCLAVASDLENAFGGWVPPS